MKTDIWLILHLAVIDLIISCMLGFRSLGPGKFSIDPLTIDLDYFALDNWRVKGRNAAVRYDRTGKHYHKGEGLAVLVDV
jgi:hypothetical protein